ITEVLYEPRLRFVHPAGWALTYTWKSIADFKTADESEWVHETLRSLARKRVLEGPSPHCVCGTQWPSPTSIAVVLRRLTSSLEARDRASNSLGRYHDDWRHRQLYGGGPRPCGGADQPPQASY